MTKTGSLKRKMRLALAVVPKMHFGRHRPRVAELCSEEERQDLVTGNHPSDLKQLRRKVRRHNKNQ